MLHIFNNDGILGIVDSNNEGFNGVAKITKHENDSITIQTYGIFDSNRNINEYLNKLFEENDPYKYNF